ncbi:MAG TPA: cytochrome P450 [Mycobacteriales bacterium]|nr:cytochrome P450 [Mycobacteriales bacterium]
MTDSLADIDVYNLDQYIAAVPHDQFRRLRAEAPVFKHSDPDSPDGYWALTAHADVVFVSRNPELFSSQEKTAMINEYAQEQIDQQRMFMLNQDPPQHTRTRSLVNRGFTPRMIARLEERIQETCEEIVATAVATGEGDFVTLCAAELPLIVIAELMGVPLEDRHKVFDWSNRMVGGEDPEYGVTEEQRFNAAAEMWAYASALAEEKRKEIKDDIVSKLISPDEAGNVLSELEFDLFFMLLAVAGNETTRNAISGGMQALMEHPDQWAKLKADPSLIPAAADEIVRWVTPVNMFRRTAMADVEVGGVAIKAGEKVVIYYTSANRDESVFTDPDTFDVAREPNPHVGFGGGGPHFCLGRHLAKLELECLFRSLITRCDHIELIAGPRRLRSNFINGIKEMTVRFVPEKNAAAT